LGVLPTPQAGQSFEAAHATAAPYTDLVPVWGKPSPFYEMPLELDGAWGDQFLDRLIRDNDMTAVVHFSFMDGNGELAAPPGLKNPSLSSTQWRNAYREAVLKTVKKVQPRYLSLGNEVNRWLKLHGANGSNGFKHWVSLYESIYNEVKRIAPATIVFCTFSREFVADHRQASMEALEFFAPNTLDVLALTSYPYSLRGINRPRDLPADYYSSVASRRPGKQLAFTEIAWWSHPEFGGEAAQAAFIRLLPNYLSEVDTAFVMWPWLTDLNEDDHVGLIEHDGTEKKGLQAWRELAAPEDTLREE
jgi:hypothetical protein